MLDTWQRSYFLTPGPRVLYLLPQRQTDEILPLQVQPTPEQLVRTLLVRSELITPEREAVLSAQLTALASANTADQAAATSALLAWGRFAEPFVARALAMTENPQERAAGAALLETIRNRKRWAPLAAE